MRSCSLLEVNADFQILDRQETRDICHPSHVEPVGLALASNGTACITWQSPRSDAQTDLCLYARDSPQMEAQSYGKFFIFLFLERPHLPFLPKFSCHAGFRSRSFVIPKLWRMNDLILAIEPWYP